MLRTFPPKTRRRTLTVVQEAAVPIYTLRDDDPASLHAFVAILSRRDPKTVVAYFSNLCKVVAGLANPSQMAVSKPI
jgi:hypothetical protein